MEIVGVEIRDAFSPVLELCGLGAESVAGVEKTAVRVQGAFWRVWMGLEETRRWTIRVCLLQASFWEGLWLREIDRKGRVGVA